MSHISNLKNTLDRAAEKNVISADQVDLLYQFILAENAGESAATHAIHAEGSQTGSLKFVRSFGDVFITLGVVLMVMAINTANLSGYYFLLPIVGFVALAEWLVRIRRLVLPGVAILVSILFFVYQLMPSAENDWGIWGFVGISVTSLLFYLRYNMPFSLLPFTASLLATVFVQMGTDVFQNPLVFVGFGLLVFIIALWFDSRDIKRESYLSDNAFWLYLLASPLVVHGAMITLFTSEGGWIEPSIFMIVFFAIFFLLSLLIDRRVMLFSTQFYIIYALTQLYQQNSGSGADPLVYIFFGIGLFVIYFGAYWYKTRRLVFGSLRESNISQYVPDFDRQDVK